MMQIVSHPMQLASCQGLAWQGRSPVRCSTTMSANLAATDVIADLVLQDGKDARQALAGATKDMAAVHAEKSALLQQWQSALTAIRQRDTALKVGSLLLPGCSLLSASCSRC